MRFVSTVTRTRCFFLTLAFISEITSFTWFVTGLTETKNVKKLIADHTKQMQKAAAELDFQKAEQLKNTIQKLKKYVK